MSAKSPRGGAKAVSPDSTTARRRATTPPASLSAFGDKAKAPVEGDLHRILGAASPLWKELVAQVSSAYPEVTEQWNFAGAKFGWSMRLRSEGRIVVYLLPQAGALLVGLVLGPRAVAAAADARLPASVRAALATAPRYAEGTGLRLPVSRADDLAAVLELVALKMSRRA